MPDSILVLQLEHRKIGKVLGVLQHQLSQLKAGLPVDRLLFDTAMDYLAGFPDQCHHPKEDLVYRKLASRFPALADSVRDLTREHEDIGHLTRELRQAFSDSRLQTDVGDAALAERLQEFLEFYNLHMTMEEQHFFPTALQHLSQRDFEEIDFSLYEQLDSELSQESEATFASLLSAVASMGNLDAANDALREEAALLSGIQDVDTFREWMRQRGEAIKVARHPDGGYTLVRDGRSLLRIPACSEARAVWCAYYYLKGEAAAVAEGAVLPAQHD